MASYRSHSSLRFIHIINDAPVGPIYALLQVDKHNIVCRQWEKQYCALQAPSPPADASPVPRRRLPTRATLQLSDITVVKQN